MRSGGQSNIKRRETLKKYRKTTVPAVLPTQSSVVAVPEPSQIRAAQAQLSQSGIVVAPPFPVGKDVNRKSTDLLGNEIKMDPETGEYSLAQVTDKHPIEQFMRGLFVPTEQIVQIPKDLIEGIKTQNQGMKETGLDLVIAPLLKPFAMAQNYGLTTSNWYWPSTLTFDNQSLPEFMQKGQGSDDDFFTGVGRNLGIIGDVVTHERTGEIIGEGYAISAERFAQAPAYYIGTAVGEIPYWIIGAGQVSTAAKVSAKAIAFTLRSGGKVPNPKLLRQVYKAERAASKLERTSNMEQKLNKVEPEKYSSKIPMKKEVIAAVKIITKVHGIHLNKIKKELGKVENKITEEKRVRSPGWKKNVDEFEIREKELKRSELNIIAEVKNIKSFETGIKKIETISNIKDQSIARIQFTAKVQDELLPQINTVRREITDVTIKTFGHKRLERVANFIDMKPRNIVAKIDSYLNPIVRVEGDKAFYNAFKDDALKRASMGEFDGPLGGLRFDRFLMHGSSKQSLLSNFSFRGRRRKALKPYAEEMSELYPTHVLIETKNMARIDAYIDERITTTKKEMGELSQARPSPDPTPIKVRKDEIKRYGELSKDIRIFEDQKIMLRSKLSFVTKKSKIDSSDPKQLTPNTFVHDFEALFKVDPELEKTLRSEKIILAQRPSVSIQRVHGTIVAQIGDDPKTSVIGYLTRHDYKTDARIWGEQYVKTTQGTGIGFRNIGPIKTLVPKRTGKTFEVWNIYKASDPHRTTAGPHGVTELVIFSKNTPAEHIDLAKNELFLEDFSGSKFTRWQHNNDIILQYKPLTLEELSQNKMIKTGKRSTDYSSNDAVRSARDIQRNRDILENRRDKGWNDAISIPKNARLNELTSEMVILQSPSKSNKKDILRLKYKLPDEKTMPDGAFTEKTMLGDIEDVKTQLNVEKMSPAITPSRIKEIKKELNILKTGTITSSANKKIYSKYNIRQYKPQKGKKSEPWHVAVEERIDLLREEKKTLKKELAAHEKEWGEIEAARKKFQELGIKNTGDPRGTIFSATRDTVQSEIERIRITEYNKTFIDTKTNKEYYRYSGKYGRNIYEITDKKFKPSMVLDEGKTAKQTSKYFVNFKRDDPMGAEQVVLSQSEIRELAITEIPGINLTARAYETESILKKNYFRMHNIILKDDGTVDMIRQTNASKKYLKELSPEEVSQLDSGKQLGSYLHKVELFKEGIDTTSTTVKKVGDLDIANRSNFMHIIANVKIRTAKKAKTGLESIVMTKKRAMSIFKGERFQPTKTQTLEPDDWFQADSGHALFKGKERVTGYPSNTRRMLGAGDDPAITVPGVYPGGWIVSPMFEIKTIFNLSPEKELRRLDSFTTGIKKQNPKKDQKIGPYETLLAEAVQQRKTQKFKKEIVKAYYKNIQKDDISESKIKQIVEGDDLSQYQDIVTKIKDENLIRLPKRKEIRTWYLKKRKGSTLGKEYGFISPRYDLPVELGSVIDNRTFKQKVKSHIQGNLISFEARYFNPDKDFNKSLIGSIYAKVRHQTSITTEELDPRMLFMMVKIFEAMPENLKIKTQGKLDKLIGKNLTADEFALIRIMDSDVVAGKWTLNPSVTKKLADEKNKEGTSYLNALGFDDTGTKTVLSRMGDTSQRAGKIKRRKRPKGEGDEDINFGKDEQLMYGVVKGLMYRKYGYEVVDIMKDSSLSKYVDVIEFHIKKKRGVTVSDLNKTFRENPKAYNEISLKVAKETLAQQTQAYAQATKIQLADPEYVNVRGIHKMGLDDIEQTTARMSEQEKLLDTKKPKSGFTAQTIGSTPIAQTMANTMEQLTVGPEQLTGNQMLPQAHGQESILDEAISSVQSTLAGIVKGNIGIVKQGIGRDANVVKGMSLQGLFNPVSSTGTLQTPQILQRLLITPITDTVQETVTKPVLGNPLAFSFANLYGQIHKQQIVQAHPEATRVLPRLHGRVTPLTKRQRVMPSFLALPPGFDISDPGKRNKKRFLKKKTKKTWWQTPEWWYQPYYWGGGKDQLGPGYVTFKGAEPARVRRYEKRFFGIGVGF